MATFQKRRGRNGGWTFRVQVRLRGAAPESATFETKTAAKLWATTTEAAELSCCAFHWTLARASGDYPYTRACRHLKDSQISESVIHGEPS